MYTILCMERLILYYGSNEVIKKPVYHYYHLHPEKPYSALDYGEGFYCTLDSLAAREWACRDGQIGIVNKYQFDMRGLKILDLTKGNDKKTAILTWVAILMHHRQDSSSITQAFRARYHEELSFLEKYYIDVTKYDVVIGYRADDAYFRFPREFITNNISLETLSSAFSLGNLGKQFVLISKKAFDHIKFLDSYVPDIKYIEMYKKRIDDANNQYIELEMNNRYKEGTKIRDLVSNQTKNHD